jgi:hypothetical protein
LRHFYYKYRKEKVAWNHEANWLNKMLNNSVKMVPLLESSVAETSEHMQLSESFPMESMFASFLGLA